MVASKKKGRPAQTKHDEQQSNSGQAERYWEEHVAPLIRGIKVSNLPMVFSVPMASGRRATIELLWGDHVLSVGEWSGVGKDIAALMRDRDPAWLLPRSWSYKRLAGKLAPGEVPHEFDIPNPRHYGLDGLQQLPYSQLKYGEIVREGFRGRICALWARRMEDRGKGLKAFLSHHLVNGGDPGELVGYVKHALIPSLRERPCLVPAPLQPFTLPQIEVGGLIHELEDWVERTAKELAVKESLKEAARIEKSAEVVQVMTEKAPSDGAVGLPENSKRNDRPVRPLGVLLDSKPGARGLFDTMLRTFGHTDERGHFKTIGRKGRAEVLAAIDAVVEVYELNGYGNDHAALRKALMDYIPDFSIQKRLNKLRNDSKRSKYQKALKGWKEYIEDKRGRDFSDASEKSL